ncbi:hypothetical protein MJO28_001644 [Puccinia striiformis f. sp. tritici]|uniref:Uncharacterized protein n=2 Tax=Puccinia striiformis f. sp. tritici TaxID=168172 RepID=A0A0L0W5L4_9BASI|nr:hypothetical protein Pst134EA_003117 [Puccinia striiformis f. sp. tritici]KAH9472507.1 hypothetical protein Pst134EA_003117 [Puccinia striiformis f. sp. tritici]KAI7961155.1 hypothetical protein MJO28_001644 [Puccinia striiformis f. sp. tritici]KNF06535.1 hypothetical protein PSTG_00409 [Puccinia striiformis f. sp. tritici PST-78]
MFPSNAQLFLGLLATVNLSQCVPLPSSGPISPISDGAPNPGSESIYPRGEFYDYDKRSKLKDVSRKVLSVAATGAIDLLKIAADVLRLQQDVRAIIQQMGSGGLNLGADLLTGVTARVAPLDAPAARPLAKNISLDPITDPKLVGDQSIQPETVIKQQGSETDPSIQDTTAEGPTDTLDTKLDEPTLEDLDSKVKDDQ